MRLTVILAAVMQVCICCIASFAQAQDMKNLSIKCGEYGTPYYRFCDQLTGLIREKCNGAMLDVQQTGGSKQNLDPSPGDDSGTPLKLSQSDMMSYAEREIARQEKQRRDGKPYSQKSIDDFTHWQRHRLIATLYNEQIHIVTLRKSGINSLNDLKELYHRYGRYYDKLGIGQDNSGTQITAIHILEMAGITLNNREPRLGLGDSLEQLLDRKLDAFFFVGGAPVDEILKAARKLALRDPSDQLSFVNVDEYQKFSPEYKPDTLKKEDYPFLDTPVKTLNTTAVLTTFDYDYNDKRCLNVAAIARLMHLNAGKLYRDPGKDSWLPNFFVNMPPWKGNECVLRYIGQIVSPDGPQCMIEHDQQVTPSAANRACGDCRRIRDSGRWHRCGCGIGGK
jgi:TRAP transporter TAXI family solute receptor